MKEPVQNPPQTALDFQVLRQIAEAASGVRDTHTWFVVHDEEAEPGRSVQRLRRFDRKPEEGADYPPGAVVIPVAVSQESPPPPLRPEWGRLGLSPEASLDLMAVMFTVDRVIAADAVFWSEAAVEKFLVPYYASVAGPDAEAAVRNLLSILHRQPRRASAKSVRNGAQDEEVRAEPGTAFAVVHIPTSEYIGVDEQGPRLMAGAINQDGKPEWLTLEALARLRQDLGWQG